MMRRMLTGAMVLWVAACVVAGAQVRVTKGMGAKSTIDWSQFNTAADAEAMLFRRTLEADLIRSGWFLPAAAGRGDFSLQGTCEGRGGVRVKCFLYGASDQRTYLSKSYRGGAGEARRLAHAAADDIVAAVTGQKGFAGSRLVVVGNRTKSKELYLCDADGQGLIQLTRDGGISVAPRWGRDGETLVYTSYLKGYPDVYSIDVPSGRRERIVSFPGLNTGADISPNGRELAVILSKDGNPELYVMQLGSGRLTRLTTTPRAAEASPCWSPDGNRIAYVSDQSGRPQLYVVSRSGGAPSRLTSRGLENVAPDWGPNGLIAYASRVGGRYDVCVLDPITLDSKQITPGDADYEDPCWAPDGRHLACSRSVRYRAAIYLLDTLGDPPVALLNTQGDWYAPAWSPR